MIKPSVVFLYAILLVFPARAQRSMRAPSPVLRDDFFITMSDGVRLDCTRFHPAAATPAPGWPVIVYCHGYADSKADQLAYAEAQAAYGYYTFAYSMRGQGASGGWSHLISTLEARDLIEVIAHIRHDTLANAARIGIFGGSQGGIIPFMAACNGLDVRCILSDFASPEFASSWMENGCVKMTLFWTVDYDSLTVRYDRSVRDIRRWILSKLPEHWDSLARNLPMNRDFMARVPSCRVPILTTNAWQDKFFNTTGMIDAAARLVSPHRAYFGAVNGHGADSSQREDRFISNLDNAWIEHWLNDIPNGVNDSTYYYYASSRFPIVNGQWIFARAKSAVWPPGTPAPRTLYFRRGNALSTAPPTADFDTLVFMNDVRDSALTMQYAINESFTGAAFKFRYPKHAEVFESAPLADDMEMAGPPRLRLHYSSTAGVCQYNFQIWEVRGPGDAGFVTRVNFADRRNEVGSVRDTVVDGLAHAHQFKKGSRVRIILTNLDTESGDDFLGTNPYVLPVFENARNTMFVDAARPSCIELPIVDLGVTGASATPVATSMRLDQNYPNPFRDVSTVTFALAERGRATLRVVDILGRIVMRVLDADVDAGSHTVTIPGSSLPAGMYYLIMNAAGESMNRKIEVMR